MDEHPDQERRKLRKLFKSPSDKIIDGVCSGFAEYFRVDPAVIRLLFVALAILDFFSAILLYIVALAIMPGRIPDETSLSEQGDANSHRRNFQSRVFVGVIFMIGGAILLFDYHNAVAFTSVPWLGIFTVQSVGTLALPIILILIGSFLLMRRGAESSGKPHATEGPHEDETAGGMGHFLRSQSDERIAGVCGGLAEYLETDSTLIRIMVVLVMLGTFGLALIAYFLCALIVPKNEVIVHGPDFHQT